MPARLWQPTWLLAMFYSANSRWTGFLTLIYIMEASWFLPRAGQEALSSYACLRAAAMKTLSVPASQQSTCWELLRLVNCFPPVLFTTTLFQITLASLCKLSCCQINHYYVMGTEMCFPSPNPEYFGNCKLKNKIKILFTPEHPQSCPPYC